MEPSEARIRHAKIMSQFSKSIPDGVATWEVIDKAFDEMSSLCISMILDMEDV